MKRDRAWLLGIARHGHWLSWGVRHGWLLRWPMWIKQPIVAGWNLISCAILGHGDLTQHHRGSEIVCCECCRRLKRPDSDPHVLRLWKLDEQEDDAKAKMPGNEGI